MRRRGLGWWLYQPYKYLVFAPVVGLVTASQAITALVLSMVTSPRTASRMSAVPWARILAFMTPMRVRVEGREHIDPQQSYVLVSNHQSQYDIFVLYGWLGHIFIDRSNDAAAMATLQEAKNRIVGGTSVMFFPEGTRSRSGKLMRFKKGAFRMALDLGLPILPLTVTGTRNVLPAGTSDLMPGSARLIIHPPIPVEGLTASDCSRLSNQVRDVIASALPSHQV